MKRLIGCLCIAFLMTPLSINAAEREHYVALGDSLAAGQTPYSEIDYGYTDMIALQLNNFNRLASFDKSLSFPGYTVEKVRDSVASAEAQARLADATLITISAGANNLLPLLAYKANKGTMSFSQLSVSFALNNVRIEFEQLLQEVQQLAPNAKLFVMGYYFPYTQVHDEQLDGAVSQLQMLNDILKQEALKVGATFVDVEPTFINGRSTFLPNGADVHPNALGYMGMANAFLQQYGLPQLVEQQLPKPQPQSFEELLKQQLNKKDSVLISYHFVDKSNGSIFHHKYYRALL